MTAVEVVFKYNHPPTETVMRAMDNLREVYGIRRISFDEKEHVMRVEYDASRLNESTVLALLRRAAIDVKEKVEIAKTETWASG